MWPLSLLASLSQRPFNTHTCIDTHISLHTYNGHIIIIPTQIHAHIHINYSPSLHECRLRPQDLCQSWAATPTPLHYTNNTHRYTHTFVLIFQPAIAPTPQFPLLPLSLCYWFTSPPLSAQVESLYWLIFKGIYKHKKGWMGEFSVGACEFLREREDGYQTVCVCIFKKKDQARRK